MRSRWSILLLAIAHLSAPSLAGAEQDPPRARAWFAQVEFHLSLLSDVADRSMIGVTFGPAAKFGHRWADWGVFLSLEQNSWVSSDFGSAVRAGAVNIGIGGEYIWAKGFVRTSAAIGPSVLLFDTALDDAGSTGIYADIRPTGLRWAMNGWLVLMLDPLTFTLVAPVLRDPALVLIEYRSTFTTEFHW